MKRIAASPRARRLAETLGVSLETLSPGADFDWIVEQDVRRADEQRAVRDPDVAAKRSRPLQNSAVYFASVDVSQLLLAIAQVPVVHPDRPVERLTVRDVVSATAAQLLAESPSVHQVRDEHGGWTASEQVHLAVRDPQSSPVVVAHAQQGGSWRLRWRMRRLRGRAGSTTQPGPSATAVLADLGLTGVTHFTPRLEGTSVSIGMGCRRTEAVVRDGAIARRALLPVSLAVDAAIVDEAAAANFLGRLCESLEVGRVP